MSRHCQLGLLGAHVHRRADELARSGEQRLLGQLLRRSPWRCRSRSPSAPAGRRAASTRTLRRLEVAVDDAPSGAACWTAWQTCDEQLQPLAMRQRVAVAVLGDRHALDELHHEVRPAGSVVPASNTLAMFGWSISARACRSASNAGDHLRVSMAGLMILSATRRRTGWRVSATQTRPCRRSPSRRSRV